MPRIRYSPEGRGFAGHPGALQSRSTRPAQDRLGPPDPALIGQTGGSRALPRCHQASTSTIPSAANWGEGGATGANRPVVGTLGGPPGDAEIPLGLEQEPRSRCEGGPASRPGPLCALRQLHRQTREEGGSRSPALTRRRLLTGPPLRANRSLDETDR